MRTWEECVQMIIEVVSGKAGGRKVGIDGFKGIDKSLLSRQNKRAPQRGNLFTLSPIHSIGKTQEIIKC